jgi:hypothetical protein
MGRSPFPEKNGKVVSGENPSQDGKKGKIIPSYAPRLGAFPS